MDIASYISQLRAEREILGEAISALERLVAMSHRQGPGRPPKWLAPATKSEVEGSGPTVDEAPEFASEADVRS